MGFVLILIELQFMDTEWLFWGKCNVTWHCFISGWNTNWAITWDMILRCSFMFILCF